jgi:predicted nucleic acid-binding Zn finger protein
VLVELLNTRHVVGLASGNPARRLLVIMFNESKSGFILTIYMIGRKRDYMYVYAFCTWSCR